MRKKQTALVDRQHMHIQSSIDDEDDDDNDNEIDEEDDQDEDEEDPADDEDDEPGTPISGKCPKLSNIYDFLVMERSTLTPADLEGVDLSALLDSLGVNRSWSDHVPHDFTVAVFAFAHTRVLSPEQAKALCELYDDDHDFVKAAWEVYCVQSDLDDFIDTMLRIIRNVDLENEDRTSSETKQFLVTANKEATAAVKNAKLDLLKHSLEMMVKQQMLSANNATGLFERSLKGDTMVDAAIENYAKDRDVNEFLETLQILGN